MRQAGRFFDRTLKKNQFLKNITKNVHIYEKKLIKINLSSKHFIYYYYYKIELNNCCIKFKEKKKKFYCYSFEFLIHYLFGLKL